VFSFGLMGFPLIIVDVRCHSGFVVVVVVLFFVLPEISYAEGSIDPDFSAPSRRRSSFSH
jgi:hypothetical protein